MKFRAISKMCGTSLFVNVRARLALEMPEDWWSQQKVGAKCGYSGTQIEDEHTSPGRHTSTQPWHTFAPGIRGMQVNPSGHQLLKGSALPQEPGVKQR